MGAALLLWASLGSAQTCSVAGWNGPATISVNSIVNAYYAGSGTASGNSISVASATGQRTNAHALVAGDLILIMQMQDSSVAGNAGLHEYAQIVGVSGTTLNLNRALSNSYTQSMNATNVRNWQVIWVPQYSAMTLTATITPDRWTIAAAGGAATGGVVAFDVAGSLALNGTVSVAGSGFRGAMGLNGSFVNTATATTANTQFTPTSAATIVGGQKGEGIQGTPPVVFAGVLAPVNYLALLGQGYALGAAGQAAISNAGGGANNGNTGDANNFNAGGGGGSNVGAGGQGGNSWNNGNTLTVALNQGTTNDIGNVAGGKGGNAIANLATRLVMGGGGGSGGANNASGDALTLWPPSPASFPPPNNTVVANGASGAITSSGAPGGGVVLIRAGSLGATAGRIEAPGYQAYNKSLGSDTDAGGGGGGGGSVFVTAGSANGAGLTINAAGGAGGSSNYFNHGPGGGGGGGFVLSNFAVGSVNVAGATSGIDACCGAAGIALGANGSPKAWNSTSGAAGSSSAGGGTAAGVQGGASCLPLITVTKSTATPTRTSAPGATASYSINLSNSGGPAPNVFVFDTLPPGWAYTGATAPTYTYSPAPPPAAGSAASGAETTAAGTPGVLPASSVTNANSVTAVSLRAAGAAPGLVPTTGAATPTFGSFYLAQNGTITVTFLVTIPTTATAGTYHNPAGVIFLDPTRVTSASRMVSPLTGVNSNRSGVNYSANTTYASGSTTNVLGSNYNGLQGGPAGEDVRLLPDISVTKTAPASATPGTTITYTITPRNNGWGIGTQSYAATQATDVSSANVPTVLGSNPLTITDTLPSGVTISGVFTGTGWTCAGTGIQVCTLANATAWPIAASTNFNAVTGAATITAICSGATTPRTNTVAVSPAAGEVNASNNTATATTALTCVTANLQVTKTNGTGTVTAGSTTSYTVTISNLGPGAATPTTLTDTPSGGLNCASVAVTCVGAGGAGCPAASMPFTSLTTGVLISAFPANSTATFVVSCTVP